MDLAEYLGSIYLCAQIAGLLCVDAVHNGNSKKTADDEFISLSLTMLALLNQR